MDQKIKSPNHFKVGLKVLFLIGIFFTQKLYSQNQFHKKLQSQFVYLISHKQKKDLLNPWRRGNISKKNCMGVILQKGKNKQVEILTTAHCIKDANYIEMKYFLLQKKQSVEVKYVDYEVNLAILTTKHPKEKLKLTPLRLSTTLKINDKATLISAKGSDRFYTQEVSLQSYKVMSPSTSSFSFLYSQFLAQKANLIGSEFILKDDRISGIVSSVKSNTCQTIPSHVIQIFLDNYRAKKSVSFASLEIKTKALNSENLRKALLADKIAGGVRVYHIEEISPFFNQLKVNDILYKVFSYPIDQKGYVSHPLYGKVKYQAIVAEHTASELTVEVLREGKTLTFRGQKTPFRSNDTLIPYYRIAKKEPHIILGGLVFQELTYEYLKTWGKNWINKAPSYLGIIWKLQNHKEKKQRRVIILSQVLPDTINNGYQNIHNALIAKVNDQKIDSLDDLKAAFDKPIHKRGNRYQVIDLRYGDGTFILSHNKIEESHKRLAQKYKITSPQSFYKFEG